jgi:putative transposase
MPYNFIPKERAFFYILRTGCQWKLLPRCYGAPSTIYDRFQEWQKAGLFERMWESGLLDYDTEKGIEWEWQAIDRVMTKAPLGGADTGANPTDRSKKGTKRSILTDALDAIIYKRPSLDYGIQNICMDRDMIILISDNWLKVMVTLLTFGAEEKKI